MKAVIETLDGWLGTFDVKEVWFSEFQSRERSMMFWNYACKKGIDLRARSSGGEFPLFQYLSRWKLWVCCVTTGTPTNIAVRKGSLSSKLRRFVCQAKIRSDAVSSAISFRLLVTPTHLGNQKIVYRLRNV